MDFNITDIHGLTPNRNAKAEIVDIVTHGGIDQLPLVYANDHLVFQGQHPDIQEMRDTLDSPQSSRIKHDLRAPLVKAPFPRGLFSCPLILFSVDEHPTHL